MSKITPRASLANILILSIVISLTHFLILGGMATWASAETELGKCEFSLQLLSDPYLKESFLTSLLEAKNATEDDMYKYIVTVRGANGELVGIDSFSSNCILCHDGMNAPHYETKFVGTSQQRFVDLTTVVGSHPIGMNYGEYTDSQEFKGWGNTNSEMSFIAGKVGCLTCHNPLNPEKFHLVMNNDKSNICLSCHIK